MFESFDTYEKLMDAVHADRTITGNGASTANRFPVRFVLFDNFRDCCRFVEDIAHLQNISMVRLEDWLDPDYPDTMLTHKRLADNIRNSVRENPSEYRIIMPFSEIARFYNNASDKAEFNTLISTIKSIDTLSSGFASQQRIYIPIVGLEGKMQHFKDDSQTFIWYFRNTDRQLNYKLILVDNTTFGVSGLENKFNIASNISQFLGYWKYPELKENIISTSHSIFSHADYAQPDNAFSYCICHNAYEFLTKGLNLDLGGINYREEESIYWQELARKIDVDNFNFENFFNQQFGIYDLADYSTFFTVWFNNKQPFLRWLLAKYYTYKFCNKGYICRVLDNLNKYNDQDFTKELAIAIFKLENPELYFEERKLGLQIASRNGLELPPDIQSYIVGKIQEEEKNGGILYAKKFLSPLTDLEKGLIINWFAEGKIMKDELLELYPDLYYYLGTTLASSEDSWVIDYFDCYKLAKVKNSYTKEIKDFIEDKNKNELTHLSWSSKFSDTRTLLYSRTDINRYFWIDGLGADWIAYIQQIVKEHEQEGYYLNEAYIATVKLPSRTDLNKCEIEALAGEKLIKIGNLDEFSHTLRPYPKFVIEDLVTIRNIITKLLHDHPGEKIAIVSDHGISYLSQLCQGYNLQGYKSDHWGRVVETKSTTVVVDDKYKVVDLEEGTKALCALKHESLGKKVPEGMGCHGGCTPEEQLVPILIISPEKEKANWNAVLKTYEVGEANPYVIFDILGVDNNVSPLIEYDGRLYGLTAQGNTFTSQRLTLNKDVTTVTLVIGTQRKEFSISIKMAAVENDLFDF